MDKLDESIANVAYILDSLKSLRDIYSTGDCNNCAKQKFCEYVPKIGQMVRYNCPLYQPKAHPKKEGI